MIVDANRRSSIRPPDLRDLFRLDGVRTRPILGIDDDAILADLDDLTDDVLSRLADDLTGDDIAHHHVNEWMPVVDSLERACLATPFAPIRRWCVTIRLEVGVTGQTVPAGQIRHGIGCGSVMGLNHEAAIDSNSGMPIGLFPERSKHIGSSRPDVVLLSVDGISVAGVTSFPAAAAVSSLLWPVGRPTLRSNDRVGRDRLTKQLAVDRSPGPPITTIATLDGSVWPFGHADRAVQQRLGVRLSLISDHLGPRVVLDSSDVF